MDPDHTFFLPLQTGLDPIPPLSVAPQPRSHTGRTLSSKPVNIIMYTVWLYSVYVQERIPEGMGMATQVELNSIYACSGTWFV